MESDSLSNLTLKSNTLVVEVYSPTEVYSPKLQRYVLLKSRTLQDTACRGEKNLEMGRLLFHDVTDSSRLVKTSIYRLLLGQWMSDRVSIDGVRILVSTKCSKRDRIEWNKV